MKPRVSEWKKILDIFQCNKCFKFGHYRAECKLKLRFDNCKFCATMDSDHESADFLDAPSVHHSCCNCKDKEGFKTKFHYFSRCKTLKITPEDKYIEFREKKKV